MNKLLRKTLFATFCDVWSYKEKLSLHCRPLSRMIERHFFRGRHLKTFDFNFGFCIPDSKNTWCVYCAVLVGHMSFRLVCVVGVWSSNEVAKTLPSFSLASWEGKPVPKKSAGGKERRKRFFYSSTGSLVPYWSSDKNDICCHFFKMESDQNLTV